MARIRFIKPEFFDDPTIADLSAFARLFYIGLWMEADREGRLADDMRRLKARVFPYDDLDAEALAIELHSLDLIRRYSTSDGKKFIWIRSFVKHQRPHPKEAQSLIPACSIGDGKKNGKPCLKTEGTPDSGFLILDSGLLNLDQEQRQQKAHSQVGVVRTTTAQPSVVGRRLNGHSPPNGQSKRPVYRGQRLTVFEWMLDDIGQILGPAYEDFGLDVFFQSLDAIIATEHVVLDKKAVWPWLQSRVLDEAKRRGLAIVTDVELKPHKLDVRDAQSRALMRNIS